MKIMETNKRLISTSPNCYVYCKSSKDYILLFKYLSYDICSWAISSPFPFNPLFPQAKANDLHKPWWNLMTHPFLIIPLVPCLVDCGFPWNYAGLLSPCHCSQPLIDGLDIASGNYFPPLLFPYALRLQFPPPLPGAKEPIKPLTPGYKKAVRQHPLWEVTLSLKYWDRQSDHLASLQLPLPAVNCEYPHWWIRLQFSPHPPACIT